MWITYKLNYYVIFEQVILNLNVLVGPRHSFFDQRGGSIIRGPIRCFVANGEGIECVETLALHPIFSVQH